MLDEMELNYCEISTHAPHTGSDRTCGIPVHYFSDFNPRSPHGERRACKAQLSATFRFQPTLPTRGATRKSRFVCIPKPPISTHAPHTGSDMPDDRRR